MKLVPIVLAITLLTACAGNKESIGTAVGGIAGAIAGNKLGGKEGAIIGAAIGATIGNRFGAYLDEEDRKKLAALEQKALTTGVGGSFVTAKTNATVKVDVSPPVLERPRNYGLSSTVKPQPLVLIEPVTIRAYINTPVFNSTNEAGVPKLIIAQGVPLMVSARAVDDNWVVVGNEKVGLGYVHKRYLEASIVSEAAPVAPTVTAQTSVDPQAKAKKGPVQPAPKVATNKPAGPPKASTTTNKDEYDREIAKLNAEYNTQSSSGASKTAQTGVVVAQVSTECKTITRKLTPQAAGASVMDESIKFCNEPPKGWRERTA